MKIHLKIVPQITGVSQDGRRIHEQVLIWSKTDYADYYPLGTAHIDTFWVKSGDNSLYAKLIQGDTVFADADIVIDRVVSYA